MINTCAKTTKTASIIEHTLKKFSSGLLIYQNKNMDNNVKRMIAVIQIYILWKTGREVSISADLPREYSLLLKAYDIAQTWVNSNITEVQR